MAKGSHGARHSSDCCLQQLTILFKKVQINHTKVKKKAFKSLLLWGCGVVDVGVPRSCFQTNAFILFVYCTRQMKMYLIKKNQNIFWTVNVSVHFATLPLSSQFLNQHNRVGDAFQILMKRFFHISITVKLSFAFL